MREILKEYGVQVSSEFFPRYKMMLFLIGLAFQHLLLMSSEISVLANPAVASPVQLEKYMAKMKDTLSSHKTSLGAVLKKEVGKIKKKMKIKYPKTFNLSRIVSYVRVLYINYLSWVSSRMVKLLETVFKRVKLD